MGDDAVSSVDEDEEGSRRTLKLLLMYSYLNVACGITLTTELSEVVIGILDEIGVDTDPADDAEKGQ